MYLLIDECCGKALVRAAGELGHTAQRTTEVAVLGRGASGLEIFEFACSAGAVVVTANHRDFESLARARGAHPGLVFVPPMIGGALTALFKTGLPVAERIIADAADQIVELQENGKIISYTV
jgi:predicted nuclease of predicted toxin-antitoxin system